MREGHGNNRMRMKTKTLLFISPLVFLTDQVAKWIIIQTIPLSHPVPIIPDFFDLTHTRNPGAAFGAFANLPDSIRLPFFFTTSTIALIAILLYYFRLSDERRSPFVALALILGGALGNIFDRIFRGEVIDFLSFHWRNQWVNGSIGTWNWHIKLEWPAFNVADAAITVGVIGLTFLLMKSKEKK